MGVSTALAAIPSDATTPLANQIMNLSSYLLIVLGDNVSELLKKDERELSKFIDAIAILLITSCVIPILVLIFLVWIVKIIFGVKITVPDMNKIHKKKDLDEKTISTVDE